MDTPLPRRPLGQTGLTVSALGLGAGQIGGDLPDAEVERLLHDALDLGLTLIDTAPSYGASEERIGRFLAGRRGDFVLSTKGGYGVPGVPDWTAPAITLGIEQALRRLRTERIDVFHLHSCPTELLRRDDLLAALRQAREQGKIGVAAYSGENEDLAYAVQCGQFGCVQTSVNLCDQLCLDATVPAAAAAGIGVIGKRPLANVAWRHVERPTGQYAEVYWDRLQALHGALDPLAGDDYLALALRFAAFAPGVSSVIAGVSSAAHLRRNVAVVQEGPLSDEVQGAVRAAFRSASFEKGWAGQV